MFAHSRAYLSPIALVLIAALGLHVLGCKPQTRQRANADAPQPPPTPQPEPIPDPPEVSAELVSANSTFGLNLFHQLIAETPDENVFVSPSSVAIALAMTYNGAAGETSEAMAKALELGDLSPEDVNAANAALMQSLQAAEPEVILSIANSLWGREGIDFLPGFLSANREHYGAELTELDFTDPKAPDRINGWVKDQTRDKITRIIDRISDLAILYLINAIYFKGDWDEPFEESATEDRPFTLLHGGEKTVPMMWQHGDYRYLEADGIQAISLPYKGDRISMVVVLPAEGSSLADWCTALDADVWEGLVDGLSFKEGTIQLPRFTLEYEAQLNGALTALGMGVAFDENAADFSKMSTAFPQIWISKVIHKTFVEVNERGTEAAAVTAVEMEALAAPPQEEPFQMVVDRPFFCAIRDELTGTLLFMGAIVDPGE